MELLVQFLVLGATAALFWFARRDLASRAAPLPPASENTEELEQLCATLEALVTDLARRVSLLERQKESFSSKLSSAGAIQPAPFLESAPAREEGMAGAIPVTVPASSPDPQYAPVYALMDSGITDAQELARRTGLSRGEVDLILSLRAKQVL